MEVFKAFAALTLTDMLSGPLAKVRAGLKAVNDMTAGLSASFGRLALKMAPVAAAAGIFIGAFGGAAAEASSFESAMAGLGRAARFEQAELKEMGAVVENLSARLPIAAEGIIALMTAGAEKGITHADLPGFAEQAYKMGKALNVAGEEAAHMLADWRLRMGLTTEQAARLGDAVTHLSRHMGVQSAQIGQIVQNAGALAKTCGVSEVQVAALGSAFLSVSAGPETATTALKKFVSVLSRSEAMSKSGQDALRALGFSAKGLAKDMQTDAEGTILKVMDALAKKPGDNQFALLTELFGGQAVSAVAPILSQIDKVQEALGLVGDAAGYAGDMEKKLAAGGKTTEAALALMRNNIANLKKSIGGNFLPMIDAAAQKLAAFAGVLCSLAESGIGRALIKTIGVLAVGATMVTSFATAMWGIGKIAPMITKALSPLFTALAGLSWPVWAFIAAAALLYAAYRANFGGIADTVDRWYNNISLVCRGVVEVFRNLTGETGVIRGELAKDIKAAGLEGFVTTVSKLVYRVRTMFDGLWDSLDFSRALATFTPLGNKLAAVFDALGLLFAGAFGTEITSATEGWRKFGSVVGAIASVVFEALATVVNLVANALQIACFVLLWFSALLRGDFATASRAAHYIWDTLVDSFMALADLFRVGDWLRAAWADAMKYLDSINLFENGARLLESWKEGMLSAADSVVDGVKGVFQSIRNFLPFSDAKVGPLSDLTLSGSRLMTTLAGGVKKGAGELIQSVDDAFADISPSLVPAPVSLDDRGRMPGRGSSYTIHIGNISLPDVKDGKDFMQSMEDLVNEYGGGIA